jgi:hypothetical protein
MTSIVSDKNPILDRRCALTLSGARGKTVLENLSFGHRSSRPDTSGKVLESTYLRFFSVASSIVETRLTESVIADC